MSIEVEQGDLLRLVPSLLRGWPAFCRAAVPWPDLQGTRDHLPPSSKMPSGLCHLDAECLHSAWPGLSQEPHLPGLGQVPSWADFPQSTLSMRRDLTDHQVLPHPCLSLPRSSASRASEEGSLLRGQDHCRKDLFTGDPLRACAWPSAERGRAGGGWGVSSPPHPSAPGLGRSRRGRLLPSRQLPLAAHTPGQGTEQQGLLRLLRRGSARGHRDASRRGPPGPAAQRGPRGRPGAAAAAATGASAKRYSRGTGGGFHPLSGRSGAPRRSQTAAGPGPPSPSAPGECALGREGRSLGQVHFPLAELELGGGVCLPPPQRAGRAVHCSFVSGRTCQH